MKIYTSFFCAFLLSANFAIYGAHAVKEKTETDQKDRAAKLQKLFVDLDNANANPETFLSVKIEDSGSRVIFHPTINDLRDSIKEALDDISETDFNTLLLKCNENRPDILIPRLFGFVLFKEGLQETSCACLYIDCQGPKVSPEAFKKHIPGIIEKFYKKIDE